ncbi:unnamed protein product [Candidula unifasciata]|uniref:Dynein regulatory complex protein 1 n=1 Tax=Candidula unifasciata TaxID=100452 RepID=A0A8S3Z5G0_9EUPU|nr:unnamed protein product [Candidula unifasciata]
MDSSEEEVDTGPSIDSQFMDERIAARRIRIAKRAETARRALMGEDPNEVKVIKEEISKSQKQIEDSRFRLTKLRRDGMEFVSNIQVAGDARETARRTLEDDAKRLRKEKLENEAKSASERFEEISKKWDTALLKEVPHALHEALLQQKRSCDAMNDDKNKIIMEFQQDLKSKDDLYVKDLKKMAEDVDLMTERMTEQIESLQKAQKEELEQIERAFVMERNELQEQEKKKWEEKMKLRRDKEEEYLIQRQKRVEEYAAQLQHMRVQDAEEYNQVKVRLETDVQILEQQLQQMKATFQLNQEKLEYNFQVLKKRDEENTITKALQKRKITRLQDVLNALKEKLTKQEKTFKAENVQLSEDYRRITEQFHDLQRKSKHFIATDAKKFHDIWCMNEEECKNLLSEVLDADKAIHEQQLGLPWEPPDVSFMDNVGPIANSAKGKTLSATKVLHDVMSEELNEEGEMAAIYNKISPHSIKRVLELLCDEAGFLVEQKLTKLLLPLEKDEQSLMKLDNIFAALGLETEDDIHKMSMYFMNIREKKEEETLETEEEDIPDEGTDEELEKIVQDKQSIQNEAVELIHPNQVLKALKAFVEDSRCVCVRDAGEQTAFHISGLEERDNFLDQAYWQKYTTVLDPRKQMLWDSLLQALDKYHNVLHSRATLLPEVEGLKLQNTELRLLLHQYVNSKVNNELEVPPTRVLQLELNQP